MENSRETKKQQLGKWGEEQAVNYLARKGYLILERNFRTPYGEIDLIAEHEGRLIFVEVKTRASEAFGYPEEAVDSQKFAHLSDAAECYLLENAATNPDWQIDVIAIRTSSGDPPEIVHFENVVE